MNLSPGEIAGICASVAVIIGQIGTTYAQIAKANRDREEARESRAQIQKHLVHQDNTLAGQNVALKTLSESTDGLAATAQNLAKQLGEAQGIAIGEAKGRAAEKANPTS
jgi:septal ring factor EnvC (AmiA/AmiB activator)